MLRREFAGEERDLALCTPRNWPVVRVGCYETERFGNLAQLLRLAKAELLGDGHVRHVLAHALAGADNPVGLLNAHRLVAETMDGQPLVQFVPLASAVIFDAFAGLPEGFNETDG